METEGLSPSTSNMPAPSVSFEGLPYLHIHLFLNQAEVATSTPLNTLFNARTDLSIFVPHLQAWRVHVTLYLSHCLLVTRLIQLASVAAVIFTAHLSVSFPILGLGFMTPHRWWPGWRRPCQQSLGWSQSCPGSNHQHWKTDQRD